MSVSLAKIVLHRVQALGTEHKMAKHRSIALVLLFLVLTIHTIDCKSDKKG